MLASLNNILVANLGPMGPLLAIGGIGLFLIIIALATMLQQKDDPLNRIKAQREGQTSAKGNDAALRRGGKGSIATDKLARFATYLEPQTEDQMTAKRLTLMRAGYRIKDSVRIFHFAQFALAIGVLVIGVVLVMIKSASQELSTLAIALHTVVPAAAGYYLPTYWVQRRIQSRQQEITEGFPDALDMMLVCVEAGQSLDQCIIRVGQEAKSGYPALAEEFEIVAHEVKAGKDRSAVLRDLAERVNLPDITSFTTTLIQSASFGTSIADALRIYSNEMRDKRVMRAEEKANTIPTKLTLGTMLFTVPPLIIMLIGPSLYGFTKMIGG